MTQTISSEEPNNLKFNLETIVQNDNGRRLFSAFLKDLNTSCDNILKLYLICCCFQNHQKIEDRQRIKQILERTYQSFFIKNEISHLSADLKQKLADSLQKTTYNESIFNAVKSELKNLLENDYLPLFFKSNFYKENANLFDSINLNTGGGASGVATGTGTSASAVTTDFALNTNNINLNENNLYICEPTPTKINNSINQSINDSNLVGDKTLNGGAGGTIDDGGGGQKSKTAKTSSTSLFSMPAAFSLSNKSKQQQQSSNNKTLKNSKSTSSSSSSVASNSSYSKHASNFKPTTSTNVTNFQVKTTTKSSNNNEQQPTNSIKIKTNVAKQQQQQPVANVLVSSMPPNPYHVFTKPLPVSAQDSEIQSVVSGDIQMEDYGNLNHHHHHSQHQSIMDLHEKGSYKSNGKERETSNPSNLKNSYNLKMHRLINKQIKQNILANKDVDLNMPELNIENEEGAVHLKSSKKGQENKNAVPLSESNPQEFFNILSAKLENLLVEDKAHQQKVNLHCSLPLNTKNDQIHTNAMHTDFNTVENLEKLSIHFESTTDIDAQLDEHLNRVYNHKNDIDLTKYDHHSNKQQQPPPPPLTTSSKTKSSKNKADISVHSASSVTLNNNFNNHHSIYKHQNQNASISSLTINNNEFYTSTTTNNNNNTSNKNNMSDSQHHHFYKLISTSKEVDIDTQNSKNDYEMNHQHQHHTKVNKKNLSIHEIGGNHNANVKNSNKPIAKQISSTNNNNNETNYDSGVSMRSNASIERVNDWLSKSGCQKNATTTTAGGVAATTSTTHNQTDENTNKNNKLNEEITTNCKTTVAYYLPNEDLAYISTFTGKKLTLAQFKQLITKKGKFRYFFKTKSDLLGAECDVYQEATEDGAFVPMYNDKVIAKIEFCNELT